MGESSAAQFHSIFRADLRDERTTVLTVWRIQILFIRTVHTLPTQFHFSFLSLLSHSLLSHLIASILQIIHPFSSLLMSANRTPKRVAPSRLGSDNDHLNVSVSVNVSVPPAKVAKRNNSSAASSAAAAAAAATTSQSHSIKSKQSKANPAVVCEHQ